MLLDLSIAFAVCLKSGTRFAICYMVELVEMGRVEVVNCSLCAQKNYCSLTYATCGVPYFEHNTNFFSDNI